VPGRVPSARRTKCLDRAWALLEQCRDTASTFGYTLIEQRAIAELSHLT